MTVEQALEKKKELKIELQQLKKIQEFIGYDYAHVYLHVNGQTYPLAFGGWLEKEMIIFAKKTSKYRILVIENELNDLEERLAKEI